MQNSLAETPTRKERSGNATAKSSGKKLVQARLPFKIIVGDKEATPAAKEVEQKTLEPAKEIRKRRLSLDAVGKESAQKEPLEAIHNCSASKENLVVSAKKKKLATEPDEVILVDDDDILDDEENEVVEQAPPKAVEEAKRSITSDSVSPKTPKPAKDEKHAKKTPGSAKKRSKKSSESSAVLLTIKLPIIGGRPGKRRKSKIHSSNADEDADERVESSDDSEVNNSDLNPQKRAKIDIPAQVVKVVELEKEKCVMTSVLSVVENNESGNGKSPNKYNVEISDGANTALTPKVGQDQDAEENTQFKKPTPQSADESKTSILNSSAVETTDTKQNDKEKSHSTAMEDDTKDVPNLATSFLAKVEAAESFKQNDTKDLSTAKGNVEQQSSSEQLAVKDNITTDSSNMTVQEDTSSNKIAEILLSSDTNESLSVSTSNDPQTKALSKIDDIKSIEEANSQSQKKILTPKQIKLMEQRRKAREEKERRLQEEKLQKQRDKEEKELVRKREREERDEQRRMEREERNEVKRKEREEKERKRLAEVEAKNEERRKRTEAKEEERKRKEQEKEEADMKAKKTAEAFQKFFTPKRPSIITADTHPDNVAKKSADSGDNVELLAFRPFEVKGDMILAPIRRKSLSYVERQKMDQYLSLSICNANDDKANPCTELYLEELKNGKVLPGRWRQPSPDSKDIDDDVQIIEDDLERAGQAIVEETPIPMQRFRAKFYKFWENRRPPYYGTWMKKSSLITSRRPLAQDKKYFDYEVDSDLEWEEEEPGESLDGSDDDKEKESQDEDYEVDNEWFVPHGHLSEEELQNDEEPADDNTREAQKAKLKVLQQEFAQEMKKKTEKIKPRLIGCMWVDENGNQPDTCPKIIWDTLNTRAMWCVVPPFLVDPEISEKSEPGSPSTNNSEKTTEKIKPITLNDQLLKDLVRLVHGNRHSKNFLIKEFLSYLEANEESIKCGKSRLPSKALVREKIDDFAEWMIMDAKVSQSNKKKNKKRLCWVVSADVLEKMKLNELGLHNKWQYTLEPRITAVEQSDEHAETVQTATEDVNDMVMSDTPGKTEKKQSKNKKMSKSNQKGPRKLVLTGGDIPKAEKVHATATQLINDKTVAGAGEVQKSQSGNSAMVTTTPVVKKRVSLLMSVPRGQQISQPTKNALISEYLKKGITLKQQQNDENDKSTPDTHVNNIIVLE